MSKNNIIMFLNGVNTIFIIFFQIVTVRTIFIDIPLIHTIREIRTLNITVKFFAPLLGATTTSYITPIWTSLNDPWWWNTNLIPFIQGYHMVNNKHLQSTFWNAYPSKDFSWQYLLVLFTISFCNRQIIDSCAVL